ncbi:hypothetical protein K2Z83_22790 [Oscillochloris sp. ZM17-4]|uniref:hypothetical protein n=1 Tax=Oscillochloris sp. ZM17-4 TaxID=2866714 RepID=UPI001C736663|nr:hypothetical protein [Oscillochloris sp. ZM17-4]MBX0330486.1 hypothetical protein [Oscillochloris sp. ZM17-4]
MNNHILVVLLSVLVIGIALASRAWSCRRAADLLAGWTTASGYVLLQSEPRYVRAGPYFWRHRRGQMIYYVAVADQQGIRRAGYVQLGGWFMGLLSNQVDVSWDSAR